MGQQLPLEGKRAIVTGGSSGIGRAASLALARAGAAVVVNSDRNVEGGLTVVQLIESAGGRAAYIRADVSRAADCQRLVDASVAALGGIDILVNNAGYGAWGSLLELSEEVWDSVLAVNLKSAFLISQRAIPVMRRQRGGSIVNIGSVHGFRTRGTGAAFAAAKAGLLGLTHAMALEFAHEGIRVNCVAPGNIDQAVYPNPSRPLPGGDPRQEIALKEPSRRLGHPEEVAAVIVFLVSDAAAFVTGATLPVDGGLLGALRIGEVWPAPASDTPPDLQRVS